MYKLFSKVLYIHINLYLVYTKLFTASFITDSSCTSLVNFVCDLFLPLHFFDWLLVKNSAKTLKVWLFQDTYWECALKDIKFQSSSSEKSRHPYNVKFSFTGFICSEICKKMLAVGIYKRTRQGCIQRGPELWKMHPKKSNRVCRIFSLLECTHIGTTHGCLVLSTTGVCQFTYIITSASQTIVIPALLCECSVIYESSGMVNNYLYT